MMWTSGITAIRITWQYTSFHVGSIELNAIDKITVVRSTNFTLGIDTTAVDNTLSHEHLNARTYKTKWNI